MMICIFCLGDLLKELLSVVVPLSTLYLAWKIYKNFDVKKRYLNKQLDAVTDLCTEIQNTKVYLRFYFKVNSTEDKRFEVKPFLWCAFIKPDTYKTVYVNGRYMEGVLPFLKYISNPILPKSIAKELRKLDAELFLNFVDEKSIQESFVVISENKIHDPNELAIALPVYTYKYMDTVKLRENIISLKEEIARWLKVFGAEDVNF